MRSMTRSWRRARTRGDPGTAPHVVVYFVMELALFVVGYD